VAALNRCVLHGIDDAERACRYDLERSHRPQQQVSDPGVCRCEIVPAVRVVDAVQNANGSVLPHCAVYFFGKDATFAFGCAIPFGLNARQQNSWMYHGGGLPFITTS